MVQIKPLYYQHETEIDSYSLHVILIKYYCHEDFTPRSGNSSRRKHLPIADLAHEGLEKVLAEVPFGNFIM